MGKGVVTSSGSDPWRKFKARVAFLGSDTLTAGVRELLSGGVIKAVEGELEVSSLDLSDGSGGVIITVRRPNAGFVVDIVASPLPLRQHSEGGDSRSPLPAPGRWRNSVSDGVLWELFNCEIVSVRPRLN